MNHKETFLKKHIIFIRIMISLFVAAGVFFTINECTHFDIDTITFYDNNTNETVTYHIKKESLKNPHDKYIIKPLKSKAYFSNISGSNFLFIERTLDPAAVTNNRYLIVYETNTNFVMNSLKKDLKKLNNVSLASTPSQIVLSYNSHIIPKKRQNDFVFFNLENLHNLSSTNNKLVTTSKYIIKNFTITNLKLDRILWIRDFGKNFNGIGELYMTNENNQKIFEFKVKVPEKISKNDYRKFTNYLNTLTPPVLSLMKDYDNLKNKILKDFKKKYKYNIPKQTFRLKNPTNQSVSYNDLFLRDFLLKGSILTTPTRKIKKNSLIGIQYSKLFYSNYSFSNKTHLIIPKLEINKKLYLPVFKMDSQSMVIFKLSTNLASLKMNNDSNDSIEIYSLKIILNSDTQYGGFNYIDLEALDLSPPSQNEIAKHATKCLLNTYNFTTALPNLLPVSFKQTRTTALWNLFPIKFQKQHSSSDFEKSYVIKSKNISLPDLQKNGRIIQKFDLKKLEREFQNDLFLIGGALSAVIFISLFFVTKGLLNALHEKVTNLLTHYKTDRLSDLILNRLKAVYLSYEKQTDTILTEGFSVNQMVKFLFLYLLFILSIHQVDFFPYIALIYLAASGSIFLLTAIYAKNKFLSEVKIFTSEQARIIRDTSIKPGILFIPGALIPLGASFLYFIKPGEAYKAIGVKTALALGIYMIVSVIFVKRTLIFYVIKKTISVIKKIVLYLFTDKPYETADLHINPPTGLHENPQRFIYRFLIYSLIVFSAVVSVFPIKVITSLSPVLKYTLIVGVIILGGAVFYLNGDQINDDHDGKE